MHIVEYDRIHHVQGQCCREEISRKRRTDKEGYRENERGQQIQQGFVDLLEDEDFRANLPPTEPPVAKNVGQVVVDAGDEEEIPAKETLLVDRHLTKATASTSPGKEDGIRRFGLYEHSCTHLNPAAELARDMTEEPVFRHGEPWMGFEGFDQQLSVPDADCSMWKCSRADFTGKSSLYSADFVFNILSLLA